MAKETDIVSLLMDVGLSEREAKVYKVLLGVSEITAAAIPKFTDVPRTKVYEVLNSLIKKGFCKEPNVTSNGQNGGQMYCAVDPKIALAGWMQIKDARLEELKKTNEKLIGLASVVYEHSAWRLKDYDFIEVLKGRQEITHRYTELRNNVTSQLLEFTKGCYAMSEEEINREANDNLKLIQAGVQVRVIYEIEEFQAWDNPYWHQKNTEIGVQARIADNLPIKMSLFGNSLIMLLLSDPLITEPNMTALIIKHPELYNVLKDVFERHWVQAKEISVSENIELLTT